MRDLLRLRAGDHRGRDAVAQQRLAGRPAVDGRAAEGRCASRQGNAGNAVAGRAVASSSCRSPTIAASGGGCSSKSPRRPRRLRWRSRFRPSAFGQIAYGMSFVRTLPAVWNGNAQRIPISAAAAGNLKTSIDSLGGSCTACCGRCAGRPRGLNSWAVAQLWLALHDLVQLRSMLAARRSRGATARDHERDPRCKLPVLAEDRGQAAAFDGDGVGDLLAGAI